MDRRRVDELLEKIRRNDPTVTRLRSIGMGEHSRYGDALQGNTVVNDISIEVGQTDDGDGDIESLLNWVQMSPSLRKISLKFGSRQRIRRFLLAIANNALIQQVELISCDAVDVDAFVSLLRSARSTLKLRLWDFGFHRTGDDAVAVVQDALRGNTSLQGLSILSTTFQVYITLLPPLSACPTIAKLSLRPPPPNSHDSGQCLQAMVDFMQSPPTSLQHLRLKSFAFQDEGFEMILQHLVQNESITKISFENCRFSQASTTAFKNLLQSNMKIQAISLTGVIQLTGPDGTIDTEAILGDILRSNTSLKELDIDIGRAIRGLPLSEAVFSCVISFLEVNLTVEHLKCGRLDDHRCSVLARSLPHFVGVKKLAISFEGTYSSRKEDLLQAFECNSSLTSVAVDQAPNTNYFSEADLKKIEFYTKRNKHVPAMLASPTDVVPLYLRPTLFVAGRKSVRGPTEIFRDLIHLGDKVGTTTTGSRKLGHPHDMSDSPH